MTRKATVKESVVERAIGDYLQYLNASMKAKGCGFCFFKQSTRGYLHSEITFDSHGRKIIKGRFRKDLNPYAWTGIPDYCVIYRSVYCGLEVKTDVGRQSDSQKSFERYLVSEGKGFYYIVRSIDDTKASLQKFFSTVDGLLQPTSN